MPKINYVIHYLLSSDRLMQTKHFPVATVSIIIFNAVIFALGLLSGEQTQIIQNYGFIPNHIFNAYDDGNNNNAQQHPLTSLLQSSEPQPSLSSSSLPNSLTRLFSSMFIHASIAHIAFNLFALAYLGGYAERAIGVPRYVLVYFTSGIVAALFHGGIASYILHNGDVVLIGASGAISGVLGIAAVAGNMRVYYWLVLQIVFAVIGSISALPIAFTAYVGGFIAGVVVTKGLVKLERSKRNIFCSHKRKEVSLVAMVCMGFHMRNSFYNPVLLYKWQPLPLCDKTCRDVILEGNNRGFTFPK